MVLQESVEKIPKTISIYRIQYLFLLTHNLVFLTHSSLFRLELFPCSLLLSLFSHIFVRSLYLFIFFALSLSLSLASFSLPTERLPLLSRPNPLEHSRVSQSKRTISLFLCFYTFITVRLFLSLALAHSLFLIVLFIFELLQTASKPTLAEKSNGSSTSPV